MLQESNATPGLMLSDINLLTQEECSKVCSVVYGLKEFWIQRHPLLPFYTLGAASYLDAASGGSDYYGKAKRYNPILRDHFAWLYKRLADTLAHQLGANLVYRDTFARPGFHIFLAHKAFEQPMASIHRDLQFQLLDWESSEEVNFANPISFTLTISLPKLGGGLNLWNIYHEDIDGLIQSEITQLVRSREKKFYPYEVGKLVLISGLQLHQISQGQKLLPGDARITLQGHGLLCQDTWQLYW
jgi:hypothetical protein